MDDDKIIKIQAEVGINDTYLLSSAAGSVEVKPTGRYAAKKIGNEGGRRAPRFQIKHEVSPTDPETKWTDWVVLKDLFKIEEH